MVNHFGNYHQLQSPLYMAMHDPVLHQFISYLDEKKRQQEHDPSVHIRIELSREFIDQVRESFKQHILQGEFQLHALAHVLSSHFLKGGFDLHSNAIGLLPGGDNRPFHIRERIARQMLFSLTDLDLGNQMIGHFRYNTNTGWFPLLLSANFVEYIPRDHPATGVNRLTSRVKAEEELWNKVTDEMFVLDTIVNRDKHFMQYSKYVKDIFGIKIVCEDEQACLRVHEELRKLDTTQCDWTPFDTDIVPARRGALEQRRGPLLSFVETKDYLTCGPSEQKKTGWKAIKSVVRWREQLFEIQVQPLSNYYLEIDHMSGPSHQSFKLTRDALRTELAEKIPLYGFYRGLLRMLFLKEEISFEYEKASIVILESTAAKE